MPAVHLLGTVGYHPTDGRNTSCLLLPELGLMLDAGTGVHRLRGLVQSASLDIVLTHAHLDHVCGLTYLTGVLHRSTVKEVTVHGHADHLAAVCDGLFNSPLFPIGPRFTPQPLPATAPLRLHAGDLFWRPQRHPGTSYGLRLETAAGTLAYITDLTADPADPAALDFIRGADLLIHECNFPNERAELAALTGHSTAAAVGQVAAAAQVKQLVITHLDPAAGPAGWAEVHRQVCQYYPAAQLATEPMVVEF